MAHAAIEVKCGRCTKPHRAWALREYRSRGYLCVPCWWYESRRDRRTRR